MSAYVVRRGCRPPISKELGPPILSNPGAPILARQRIPAFFAFPAASLSVAVQRSVLVALPSQFPTVPS